MIGHQAGAPLRFATFLAPNMLPVYRFLADRIANRLERPVELVVGSSFDQFQRGEADLGVICGLPYVWLADRRPRPGRAAGRPGAGRRPLWRPSGLLLRRDRPPRAPDRLPGGATGLLVGLQRTRLPPGHTVTLYGLVRMGARPGFFTRVVEAGYHQRAVRLVASGAVDAAAIDSQVLAVELRAHPHLADRLRVIGSFGPSTIQPVVAASQLPEQLKGEVRDLLVELGDDPTARPVLDHGFIDQFTPVDDAAYDDIRAMLSVIEAAGWTSLTQTSVAP
jgi:ABC-type phosphate/phosphonate transport system substrate-binding protein